MKSSKWKQKKYQTHANISHPMQISKKLGFSVGDFKL